MAYNPRLKTMPWEKEPKENAYSRALQSAGLGAKVNYSFYDLKEQYRMAMHGPRDSGLWFSVSSFTRTINTQYEDFARYVIHDVVVDNDEIPF